MRAQIGGELSVHLAVVHLVRLLGAAEEQRQVDELLGRLEIGDQGVGDDTEVDRAELAPFENSLVVAELLVGKELNFDPLGYGGPRVTSSAAMQRLFARHGYDRHGDVLDEAKIRVILVAVGFNDLPHAMCFGRTPQQFVGMFRDALGG